MWTEQVGPGGEFAQTDLFQAKTIGAGQCTAPITRGKITGVTLHDDSPSLVLVPASGGTSGAHLSWSRNDGERGESGSIMYSRAGCTARWSAPLKLASTGNNLNPDMTRVGDNDYLAFTHDDRSPLGTFPIFERLSPNGVASVRGFGGWLQGNATHIGAAGPTRILLLFQTGGRLASLRFHGLCWHHDFLTGAGAQQQPVAVTAVGGAFTVFGVSLSTHRLYSIRVSAEVADPPACPPAG